MSLIKMNRAHPLQIQFHFALNLFGLGDSKVGNAKNKLHLLTRQELARFSPTVGIGADTGYYYNDT